jgi:hypothetical protein
MRPANLDPNDPAVRTAVFGQEVQDFLHSPIGDFLLKRAEAKLEQAISKLKKINPEDATGIITLQNEIELLEAFESWLGDAVVEGLTAIAVLEGEEDAEDA